MQLWWLLSDGTWQLGAHSASPSGDAYHASWAGDQTMPADIRTESGGGSSMRYINYGTLDEFVYHFYTGGSTPPAQYVGVASCFLARKILHDPGGTDDRAQARLMADAAGDWWIYQGATWDNFQTNTPMGYNRFKYLTNDWQLISFYSKSTLSAAQIRANPPPFIGLQLLNEQPGPEPDPFVPLVLPTRGNWFAKETSAMNTWAAHGVANVATNKLRRRRGAKLRD